MNKREVVAHEVERNPRGSSCWKHFLLLSLLVKINMNDCSYYVMDSVVRVTLA